MMELVKIRVAVVPGSVGGDGNMGVKRVLHINLGV